MKKHNDPSRLVYLVITIIVVIASLVGLYFRNPVQVLIWLTGVGILLGIVTLLIGLFLLPALAAERKSKKVEVQGQELFRQHQARFYCHICGKPSPKPYQYWDQDGEDGQLYSEFLVADWDKPTELSLCSQCYKWTCTNADPSHMTNGVCKNCLENIHLSRAV